MEEYSLSRLETHPWPFFFNASRYDGEQSNVLARLDSAEDPYTTYHVDTTARLK